MGQDDGLKLLAHETGAKCKDEDSDRFAEGAILQLGVIVEVSILELFLRMGRERMLAEDRTQLPHILYRGSQTQQGSPSS